MDLYSDGIAPSAKKSYRKLNPAAGISLPLNLQIVIRPPSRSPPIWGFPRLLKSDNKGSIKAPKN